MAQYALNEDGSLTKCMETVPGSAREHEYIHTPLPYMSIFSSHSWSNAWWPDSALCENSHSVDLKYHPAKTFNFPCEGMSVCLNEFHTLRQRTNYNYDKKQEANMTLYQIETRTYSERVL